jgi:CubicO group peptidase (beta-lactamase class C family)
MGIMILKEAGELTFDQDIKDIIPELPYEGISIRHLLSHVSGLPDYINLMDHSWKPGLDYNDPDRFVSGNADIIQSLVDRRPEMLFLPGERFEYSNTGYLLLATIIERVSGLPFGQFMKEEIFIPAGMESTLVYDYIPEKDSLMPLRVFGYRMNEKSGSRHSMDAHYLNTVTGDGGIYSTVQDLAKWDRILYTEKLVSSANLEEAYSPTRLNNGEFTNYGFGVFIGESPTHKKVVEHGGGWVGFRTYIYREIEEQNCIVILSNNSCQIMPMILKVLKKILHK